MKGNRYLDEFGKPFPASDVSWRMQYVDKTKSEGYAVPYLNARAISERLDSVVGQSNWKDDYKMWHCYSEEIKTRDKEKETKSVNSQLCTIYVYDDERNEWIGKTDGAENTDFESVKGGLSDSFKRAAVKWNIGRYLYGFEPVWVKAVQRGRAYVVAKEEESRLENVYNETVMKMFGQETSLKTQVTNVTENIGQPNAAPRNTNNPQIQQVQNPQPQQPPTPQKQHDIYEIKSIRCEGEGETVKSTLVLNKGGKENTMFMYAVDPKLKSGTKLMNLRGHQQKNAYGTYLILEGYDIAA